MSVFSKTFFALVGRNFVAFSFFSAWHKYVYLLLSFQFSEDLGILLISGLQK